MPEFSFSIDLHCHPQYKPFGRSFTDSSKPPEPQATTSSRRSSLYYYDPPSVLDKGLNYVLSLTKFSQTNLTASLYGRNMVMAVGLGATERGFFNNKLGTSTAADLIDDFAAGFGRPRINVLQGMQDYWTDFLRELQFMDDCRLMPVQIDHHWYTYDIPADFNALQANIAANEIPEAGESKSKPLIISLISAVEGLHILNCGLPEACDPDTVKANARALKKLPFAPWFVTFTHHFYNELCGHARSLRQLIGKLTDQEDGINSGFTALGEEVMDILLDNNTTNGRRILIDMKHMSPAGRKQFIQWRKTKYNNSFPLIFSHAVCNGLPSHGQTISHYPELGNHFINDPENTTGGDGEFKEHNGINFYDDEIIEMVKSEGIMGLQLDERRLANPQSIKQVKHSMFRHKIMHYRSELVWKQLQYIGELLDDNGLYAWGNIAIGSDYDGVVDPLNAFWTAEEFDDLAGYVERHAHNYFTEHSDRLKNNFNKISADKLVQDLFYTNAWNFMKRWF